MKRLSLPVSAESPASGAVLSRRRLLRNLGRLCAAAGLLGAAGLLTSRGGDGCSRASACDGCGLYRDCTLPQARQSRAAANHTGGNHG
jgi:hypothetical protein